MDDTAQNPQTQSQPVQAPQVPGQSSVTQGNVQQATPVASQQSVPVPTIPVPTSASNVADANVAQAPVASQQPVSNHPEQGPVGVGLPLREAAPVDEAEAVAAVSSDDAAAQPDEAADVAHESAPDVSLQEAQPAVEVSRELQEAGVEKGEDAEREQLPEEQLAKPDDKAQQQPDTQAAASGISLTSPVPQIEEVKKKNGIRSALKWLAVSLLRQLKRMQLKPEQQKTTW